MEQGWAGGESGDAQYNREKRSLSSPHAWVEGGLAEGCCDAWACRSFPSFTFSAIKKTMSYTVVVEMMAGRLDLLNLDTSPSQRILGQLE